MKIICIDDEPLILNITVELCEKLPQQPQVVGFIKASDAFSWLNGNTADIAIIDINMPDLNGLELASKIREIDPATAIIFYDRSIQKQLDVIIRSMRSALEAVGAQDVFEIKNGTLRILPEKVDCDLYRFLAGDDSTTNSYRGEYMSAYSRESMTEAFLTRVQNRKK